VELPQGVDVRLCSCQTSCGAVSVSHWTFWSFSVVDDDDFDALFCSWYSLCGVVSQEKF